MCSACCTRDWLSLHGSNFVALSGVGVGGGVSCGEYTLTCFVVASLCSVFLGVCLLLFPFLFCGVCSVVVFEFVSVGVVIALLLLWRVDSVCSVLVVLLTISLLMIVFLLLLLVVYAVALVSIFVG